jgi:AcrR family transcriptional regulator
MVDRPVSRRENAGVAGRPARRSDGAPTELAPRERILTAATELFSEDGVGGTGVDALIASAGVAKATFYRHFPSKDDLVVAWLRDPRTRWFEAVTATAEERASSPSEVIPSLFEAVAEWLEGDDYRGCPYLNTIFERPNRDLPTAGTIRDTLAEIGAYLEGAAARAGHPDPAKVGFELHALLAGTISLGVANRTGAYALAASDVARRLLA